MSLLTLASCGDDISRLGSGEVFECKIDGRDWQPRVQECTLYSICDDDPVVTSVFQSKDGSFEVILDARIDVDDIERESLSIGVGIRLDSLGITPLPQSRSFDRVIYSNKASGGSFSADTSQVSTVTITQLDTASRVVIGNFDLNLVNFEGKKLRISDGKFNLKIDQR
jgi:hypothetical protein